MRMRLVPDVTKIDFFSTSKYTFGASILAMVASIVLFFVMGLNYGIDFQGGTTMRTQSQIEVKIADYRAALNTLNLGDIAISEVFDPAKPDQNVAQVRIQAQDGDQAITNETISAVKGALQTVDPAMEFLSTESVGPKVSGELIQTAIEAVLASMVAVLFYIWLRFEWQFAIGAVAALVHDVVLTIGVFSVLQIQFDLTIVAALLTIVGYSLNDTVVVFDRVRENLRKFKVMPLGDLLNLSINDTLSRTVMTSGTTLIALFALFMLGGDVIRGFVFAMIWGIVVGTYSSVFVASKILLFLDVKRDWSKPDGSAGNQYANIDA
jgi:preprotein translocase subunit SecF